MTKGADFYRLQCLDSEKDSKQRRLAEVQAALGESAELKQARQALERARAVVQKWTPRQRDLELELQGLTEKISQSEQRLYGGVVKNPKELADLQKEIATLRERRGKLEDDVLQAMIEREAGEAAQMQAKADLDEAEASWSVQQANLLGQQEMLQGEMARIEQARAELLPHIAAGDLVTYQSLRRRKGGLAVVQVSGDACSVCGVAVSPSLAWQLRQEGLGYCGNCERIIVRI